MTATPRRLNERGDSIVEMMSALAIFAIVMSMVVIIISVVVSTSHKGLNQGLATSALQQDLITMAPYVNGAITPFNATDASVGQVSASTGSADPLSLTTTSPCWGDGDPYPTDEGNTSDWASPASATQDEDTGIIVAHDFDFEFCALPPNPSSATPHIYEMKLVCASNAPANGDCTLEVIDYGSAYASTDYEASTLPTGAAIVASIQNVWCDAWCQGLVTGGTGDEACSSYVNAAGTIPTYTHEPCSSSTESVTTPPVFNYYSASGAPSVGSPTGSLNNAGSLMDLSTSSSALEMLTIGTVSVDLTILADPTAQEETSAGITGHAGSTSGIPGSRTTEEFNLTGITG